MRTATIENGKRYGRLVAIKRVTVPLKPHKWLCVCDCGNQKKIALGSLTSGSTRSCGCLFREYLQHRRAVGIRGTPEGKAWRHMIQRCFNVRDTAYQKYGGRGITVCKEWVESFERFYADMGPRPTPKHSLDRINNDGNYEPSNCRWATKQQQLDNRSCTVYVVFRRETKTLSEWCREYSIDRRIVGRRLDFGWSVDRAFTYPIKRKPRKDKT